MVQQIMSHIAAIKKDMIILEKSEFSTLKHEYEVGLLSSARSDIVLPRATTSRCYIKHDMTSTNFAKRCFRLPNQTMINDPCSTQKQSIELRQLKQTVADELQKVKSGVTLDMSLERARTKEDVRSTWFLPPAKNTCREFYLKPSFDQIVWLQHTCSVRRKMQCMHA